MGVVPGAIIESSTFVKPPIRGQGLRLEGSSSGSVGLSVAAAAGSTDYVMTVAGLTLLSGADAAAQRTSLGLGTAATQATSAFDAAGAAAAAQAASQPLDPTLTAFAALTIAANSLSIGSGADAFSQTTFAASTFPARASTGNLVAKTITDFALTFLDDADAATVRATIGAGTGNGDALTSGTLAQFAATTSLQLLGVISDETGSGSLVFANTPTLITPVLGVATATSVQVPTLTAGANVTSGDGVAMTIDAGSRSGTAGGNGGALTVRGGANTTGTSGGPGGALNLYGGASTNQAKGAVNIAQSGGTISLFGGATISATTGTGVLVQGTTPTFTTSIITPLINGSTSSGGTLTIASTSNATKGKTTIDSTLTVDGVNLRVGIGQASPGADLHIQSATNTLCEMRVQAASAGASITSRISVIGDSGEGDLIYCSSTYSAVSGFTSRTLVMANTGSTGLDLIARDSAGVIRFITGAFSTANAWMTLGATGTLTHAEGANIAMGTTTGSKIGTATSQKIGLFNVAPIIQPAAAAQAALTDNTTGTPGSTLVDVGVVFSQAAINNNFATLYALVAALRTAGVNLGIWKGAA